MSGSGAATARDQDTTGRWPVEHYDPAATNSVPAEQAPDPGSLNLAWTAEVSGTLVQPLVGDAGVYAVSRRPDIRVNCLDPRTGNTLWRRAFDGVTGAVPALRGSHLALPRDDEISALAGDTGQGVSGRALADSEYRFVALSRWQDHLVYLGKSGEVGLVDGRTLDQVWERRLEFPEHPTAVAVADGTAYVATREHRAGDTGGQVARVRAFDAASGDLRWTTETPADAGSVTTTGDVVAVGTATEVLGLDAANGRELWSIDAKTTPEQFAVRGDRLVFGGYRRLVTADVASGDMRWQDEFGSADVRVAVAGRTVFAVGGGSETTAFDPQIAAFDLRDGSRLWSHLPSASELYGPTVADGSLFVSTASGTVHAFN
jgi:outer membrane protein assembly factor BamB